MPTQPSTGHWSLLSERCSAVYITLARLTGSHPSWSTLLHFLFFLVHSYVLVGLYQFSTVIYSWPARAQKIKKIITLRLQKNSNCPNSAQKSDTQHKINLFHVILFLENINTMAPSVTATTAAHNYAMFSPTPRTLVDCCVVEVGDQAVRSNSSTQLQIATSILPPPSRKINRKSPYNSEAATPSPGRFKPNPVTL